MEHVYGCTTMHIFDITSIDEEWYNRLELLPGINGWHTNVTAWMDGDIAVQRAAEFLTRVVSTLIRLGVLDTRLHVGPQRELKDGIMYYDMMLMVYTMQRGWVMMAKVEVAMGDSDAIDKWMTAEEQQWF